MYAVATILDPRFKSKPFLNKANFESAKEKIIEELKVMFPQNETHRTEAHAPPTSSDEPLPKRMKKSSFWSFYSSAFSEDISEAHSSDDSLKDYEDEVNAYLEEKLLDPKLGDEVGNYWRLSANKTLKLLSKKYLCIPPSTVYSERLFSTAGNICDSKRNRLDPEKVKILVSLKTNLA